MKKIIYPPNKDEGPPPPCTIPAGCFVMPAWWYKKRGVMIHPNPPPLPKVNYGPRWIREMEKKKTMKQNIRMFRKRQRTDLMMEEENNKTWYTDVISGPTRNVPPVNYAYWKPTEDEDSSDGEDQVAFVARTFEQKDIWLQDNMEPFLRAVIDQEEENAMVEILLQEKFEASLKVKDLWWEDVKVELDNKYDLEKRIREYIVDNDRAILARFDIERKQKLNMEIERRKTA